MFYYNLQGCICRKNDVKIPIFCENRPQTLPEITLTPVHFLRNFSTKFLLLTYYNVKWNVLLQFTRVHMSKKWRKNTYFKRK